MHKFAQKLNVFYERWPDRAEKWKDKFGHLLEKLPEGERVWCLIHALHSHLENIMENGVSEDIDTPVMQ